MLSPSSCHQTDSADNTTDITTNKLISPYKLRNSTRQKRTNSMSMSMSMSDSDHDHEHNHQPRNIKLVDNTNTSNNNANNATNKKHKRTKSGKGISKKAKKETPPEKRRVRTGCLTCRAKHKKCDETKPICNYCKSKGLVCIWPSEGMTRPSQLNDTLKQLMSLKKMENASSVSIPVSNSDSNLTPNFHLNNELNLLDYRRNTENNNNNTASSSTTTLVNSFNTEPKYLNLPTNFPSILSIIPALQRGDFSSNISSFIFFNDKSVTSTNSLFTQSLTNLLSNYFLTDPTYILHLGNPNHILSLSRESKSLTYAILAISSRLLEQFDTSYSGENTLDFYILSVRELSKSLRNEVQGIIKETISRKECIWWTVVLLAWFEVFSVDPIESWDRIEGIINFFDCLGYFEDTKSFHTFISIIMIPYCCKMKQLQDSSNSDPSTNLYFSTLMKPSKSTSTASINSSIELTLQKICSSNKNDILNLTFQTFFVHGDIKQWVELWNSLLDWKLRSKGNEEFTQPDGAIILAVDKDLFNYILYHIACYHLLNNKPDNVSLIFQSPNDYTTIVAFAMCQERHDCDELIQWHRNRLIKILQSNMITKNKKSIYSSCACWFAGFVLNDDKFDKSEIKLLLKQISSWCNLEIFKWLINTYD